VNVFTIIKDDREAAATMKIVIPGGSGQTGSMLARALIHAGHDVVVLSRRPEARPWRVLPWDGRTLGEWSSAVDGCDVVINLAGRSVNCRYTPENRREIFDSRIQSTQLVAQAIAIARRPPPVWLQASTATIYAHRYDAANDEMSGIIGGAEPDAPRSWDFSIEVARAWEQTFSEATTPRTRKIALRSAVTMTPDPGGIFDTLLYLVRRGLGGTAGDGRQFVSWVHHRDFVRALLWLIARDDIDGAINIAAPNPLPNAEFMKILREAAGVPVGVPVTKWMLAAGAVVMRTETELVLKSRRVVPGRLLAGGFTFDYPRWQDAAPDLCKEWKAFRERRGHAAAYRAAVIT
jgi:uncharacterized protein